MNDVMCGVCTYDVFSHIRLWCACITMVLNCVSMSLYTTVSRCGVCTAVNGFVPLTGRRTHLVLHYIYIVFTIPGRMPHRPHSLEPNTIFHHLYGAPSRQDRLQSKRNKNDNRPINQAGAHQRPRQLPIKGAHTKG